MIPLVEHLSEDVTLYCGDAIIALKTLEPNSVDSIVTDPPYGLEFMGKGWDGADGFRRSLNAADAGRENVFGRTSRRSPEYRAGRLLQVFLRAIAIEAMRVLKPGGYILSFGGTRTYHRMACAIEDAGFEIRDMVAWLYGSGFPKSLDVSKAIDKAAGELSHRGKRFNTAGQEGALNSRLELRSDHPKYETYLPATDAARKWQGFGTALKPACEPIVMARKPLSESTVAANVLKWGTGALNIDGCRVAGDEDGSRNRPPSRLGSDTTYAQDEWTANAIVERQDTTGKGRWPANVIHDGSEDVVRAFPESGPSRVGNRGLDTGIQGGKFAAGERAKEWTDKISGHDDNGGSAARFFYTAKADADDRLGSKHPTVKPVDLMQYLVRLVTPPKGLVLDPFAGTGTTAEACIRERMRCILIEREEEYQNDIRRRVKLAMAGPDERKRESAKAKHGDKPYEPGSLFAS